MTLGAWLASHDAITAALLGTILGAVLSFALTFFTELFQRRRQRKVVSMRIATDLRQWLNRVDCQISETRTFLGSQGCGGSDYTDLPDFRFEADLNSVAQLDPSTAKRVFELIHEKDAVNAGVEATQEYEGREEAIDFYLGKSAALFLTAMTAYDDIARRVGWPEKPFADETDKMAREIDTLSRQEAERLASSQSFFTETEQAV